MVGLGTIFVALQPGSAAVVPEAARAQPVGSVALMLRLPFPYIANEAGWIVTELGVSRGSCMADANVPSGLAERDGGRGDLHDLGFAGCTFLLGVLFS